MRRLAVGTIACAGGVISFSSPALADTLDGALVQAYQNNPTLNSQRASVRATDEGVPQALSGYRPRVTLQRLGRRSNIRTRRRGRATLRPRTYTQLSGNMTPSNLRADGDADALQRLSDLEPHAAGGEPGAGGARDVAGERADGAADRGDRLHEPAARCGDPRSAAAQRRGACRSNCGRRATASMSAR